MTHTLLRSGCPDDFLSLGENGQAVFDSALQIRETLRLRNQQSALEILAIPQINDSGERIDWYAPRAGEVTSWDAASEPQRSRALIHLSHCLNQLRQLSSQCRTSEKTSLRLFGLLLDKAMQFPDSQHVWLVDDKPVITFWGFVHQGETAREEALACLRRETPEALPDDSRESAPQILSETAAEQASQAVETEAAKCSDAPAPASRTASPRPRRPLRGTFLTCIAVLAAIAGGGYWLHHSSQPEQTLSGIKPTTDKEHISARSQPEAGHTPSSLPLVQATIQPPVLSAPAITAPEPPVPSVKERLLMPGEALKHGSTQFLNGIWSVQEASGDPGETAPPTLRYRIVNNKGTVSLFNQNHVRCQAEIFSGLHQSGILMIKVRGSARCSDGSRYRLPEISCKADDKAVAQCTGRYPDGRLAPVIFEKVSKS